MLFTSYEELEKRSTERYTQANMIYMLMQTIIFATISIVSMLLFGTDLSNNLLSDLALRAGAMSVIMRTAFCFLLFCQIPYFFIALKEYALAAIDEVLNCTLSTQLETKVTARLLYDNEEADGQNETASLLGR